HAQRAWPPHRLPLREGRRAVRADRMRAPRWPVAITIGLAALLATGAAPAQERAIYPNSWALVVGINAYQRAPSLNYAVAAAKAVAEALPGLGFPGRSTRVFLDGSATKAAIEKVLYEDFAGMRPDDRLLVYFAGHGETAPIKGGEEGYILPADANPAALARTAIPMEEVRRIGHRVRAQHLLLV